MSKRPGERRTHATFQAITETADALGQFQPTWSTIATAWCLKRQLSAREILATQQLQASADFVLETWVLPSLPITPQHQVVINSQAYGISRVDNLDDRNETMRIYCAITVTPEEA